MTYEQWVQRLYWQRLADAVERSDDLRIPRNAEKVRKDMERQVNALRTSKTGARFG